MLFISTLLFAMALSFDGFGVGVAYGVSKIKIPFFSLLVISITSALAISLSMLAGHLLSAFVSVKIAERVGAIILILVGLWIIFQPWLQRKAKSKKEFNQETAPAEKATPSTFKFQIKSLGLVIQIIKEPSAADLDSSGTINLLEAFFLGLALAMDALGAGFGAAMAGFKPILTPLIVGIVKFIFVSLGDYCGRRYAPGWLGAKAAILPGWVLIILGISKVY